MKDFPSGWSTCGMLFSNQTAHYCKASAPFLQTADFLSSGLRSSQVTSNIGLLTRWLMNQPIRHEKILLFFFFLLHRKVFSFLASLQPRSKVAIARKLILPAPQDPATLLRWTRTAFHLRCRGRAKKSHFRITEFRCTFFGRRERTA